MAIHPTAVVSPGAEIDRSVEVGPFAVIGPQVRIGAGSVVGAHTVIEGRTTLGRGNRIFPFASLGAVPQDLKYAGEPTELLLGDENQVREFVTLHLGTSGGGGVTRVGSHNLLMANSHVAHDVQLGDRCILANSVALAGHVRVEDHVVLGGLSGVHQFCRLGAHAFVAAGAMVTQDVPPFCTVHGDRARLVGLNSEGLGRRGYSSEQLAHLKAAYRLLFRSGLGLGEAVARARAELGRFPEVERLLAFVEKSERGVVR